MANILVIRLYPIHLVPSFIPDSANVVTVSDPTDGEASDHINMIVVLVFKIGNRLSNRSEENRLKHISIPVVNLASKELCKMFIQQRKHLRFLKLMVETVLDSSVRLEPSHTRPQAEIIDNRLAVIDLMKQRSFPLFTKPYATSFS